MSKIADFLDRVNQEQTETVKDRLLKMFAIICLFIMAISFIAAFVAYFFLGVWVIDIIYYVITGKSLYKFLVD